MRGSSYAFQARCTRETPPALAVRIVYLTTLSAASLCTSTMKKECPALRSSATSEASFSCFQPCTQSPTRSLFTSFCSLRDLTRRLRSLGEIASFFALISSSAAFCSSAESWIFWPTSRSMTTPVLPSGWSLRSGTISQADSYLSQVGSIARSRSPICPRVAQKNAASVDDEQSVCQCGLSLALPVVTNQVSPNAMPTGKTLAGFASRSACDAYFTPWPAQ